MATAATLDAVVGKLEELNKSVERGFKSIGPPIETGQQITEEGLRDVAELTSITSDATEPSLDTWKGMKNHLEDLNRDSGTADISRTLTLEHLGEISLVVVRQAIMTQPYSKKESIPCKVRVVDLSHFEHFHSMS